MAEDTICNERLVSQEDKAKLDGVKNELYALGETIAKKMESLYNEDAKIGEKLNINNTQFKADLEKYKATNAKIKQDSEIESNDTIEGMQNKKQSLNMSTIDGMLLDSDLKVLQENYSYIFWGILAVGLLTVTLKTMNK